MGDHTKYGGYIVNYDRVRTYCVPQNLDSFKVCRHIFHTRKVRNVGCMRAMRESIGEEENKKRYTGAGGDEETKMCIDCLDD